MTTFKDFQGPTFSMQVPTDWLITSTAEFQAVFVAPKNQTNQSEQTESTHSLVQPNLIVSMRRLKEGVTAQAVAESTRAIQAKDYPEYQVLDEGQLKNETTSDSFQRVYTWHKDDSPIPVCQRQVFYVASPILYTLTASRPDTEAMRPFDEIFNHMLQSFKVKARN